MKIDNLKMDTSWHILSSAKYSLPKNLIKNIVNVLSSFWAFLVNFKSLTFQVTVYTTTYPHFIIGTLWFRIWSQYALCHIKTECWDVSMDWAWESKVGIKTIDGLACPHYTLLLPKKFLCLFLFAKTILCVRF